MGKPLCPLRRSSDDDDGIIARKGFYGDVLRDFDEFFFSVHIILLSIF